MNSDNKTPPEEQPAAKLPPARAQIGFAETHPGCQDLLDFAETHPGCQDYPSQCENEDNYGEERELTSQEQHEVDRYQSAL
jgi:hypothetical protein